MTLSAISDSSAPVDVDELLPWMMLEQEQVDGKERFLLESLYASLLEDINKNLSDNEEDKDSTTSRNWRSIAKLAFLMLVGLVYFAAEGFDGIASMLGLTTLSGMPVFAIGVAFALVWATLFFAVHLMEIAKEMGVTMINAPRLVHMYTRQVDNMKAIRKKINKAYDEMDEERLKRNIAILHMLQMRMDSLDKARNILTSAFNNPLLIAGKYILAAVAGVVFFCGGFMAGQTVALAFAALFVASVSPTAWPIILFCVAIGLAAFGFYWFVERHGIENLIGRCIGLDKAKVDAFCNKELVDKENTKLNRLSDRLSNRLGFIEDEQALLDENRQLRSLLERQRKMLYESEFIRTGAKEETPPVRKRNPGGQILFFSDKDSDSADLTTSRSDLDDMLQSDGWEADETEELLQSQDGFYERNGDSPLRCQ